MSQPPTASQSYSHDGRSGDGSRPTSASLEGNRRISPAPAPQMPGGRLDSGTLPRDHSRDSTGAASRFRSILNPPDAPIHPSSEQRPFVGPSERVPLSALTAAYNHGNWSRLNPERSTQSSPRLWEDPSGAGIAQEHRESSAPLPSQRVSVTTGVSVPSLYHHASAPDLSQLAARAGQSHQQPPNVNPHYPSYNPQSQRSPRPLPAGGPIKFESSVPRPRTQTSSPPRYGPAVSTPSSGQPNYRMMTLETEQGNIAVRVDVEAASRVADEKRRRNAGASARFRARRKEKEQANSKEIDELKREIHELAEEADFYRQERDYLAAALLRTAERDRHFPRPLSPRQRRGPTRRRESSTSSIGGPSHQYETYEEQGERGEEGRHTRRRISTETHFIHQPPPPPPPTSASAQFTRSAYGQQPYGPPTTSRPTAMGQLQSHYPQRPPEPQSFEHQQRQRKQPPQSPGSVPSPFPADERGKPP